MAWFDRRRDPDPPPPEGPPVLADERIVHWFGANDYAWFRDGDGDLGGLWRGRVFYFFRFGDSQEVLQVRGHWNRAATIERLPELLEVCNEWAVERLWPKTYTRVGDDGRVSLIGETSFDLEDGATDEQLADLIECGLATATAFFDHLDARFPDPLAVAP